MTIEQLEVMAMDMLVAGDDPVLAVLRAQWGNAHNFERERTEIGWYTEFDIPPSAPKIVGTRFQFKIGDVFFPLSDERQCGFHIQIQDGQIVYFECYTHDHSDFPRTLPNAKPHYVVPKRPYSLNQRIHFVPSLTRDIEFLRTVWAE